MSSSGEGGGGSGGGRRGSNSQSPTRKVLQPPGTSHPAQEPPLLSTGNRPPKILPQKVASLQGNRSRRRMSTTCCQEMSGRTEVAVPQAHPCLSPRSRTGDAPDSALWGRGCRPPPCSPRSPGSLLSPAPKPSLLRLSSLGAPAPKPPSIFRPGRGRSHRHPSTRVVTSIPHLSHSAGDTRAHSHTGSLQPARLLPSFRKQRGLLAGPNTTMATAGTPRGEEAAAASGCDGGHGGRGDTDAQHPPGPHRGEVSACSPPTPAQHLLAQWRGDPECITGAQACQTASKAHSFSRITVAPG